MKKSIFTVLLACLLTLAFASCNKGGGVGGGTFTITGIPSQYNGKYAGFAAAGSSAGWNEMGAITGYQSFDQKNGAVLSRISNGKVSMPTWKQTEPVNGKYTKVARYSGNDTFNTVVLIILDKGTYGAGEEANPSDVIGSKIFSSVEFSNGSAAISW